MRSAGSNPTRFKECFHELVIRSFFWCHHLLMTLKWAAWWGISLQKWRIFFPCKARHTIFKRIFLVIVLMGLIITDSVLTDLTITYSLALMDLTITYSVVLTGLIIIDSVVNRWMLVFFPTGWGMECVHRHVEEKQAEPTRVYGGGAYRPCFGPSLGGGRGHSRWVKGCQLY